MNEVEFWNPKPGVPTPQALVVGDAVLDRWVRTEPTRLSREAPVPVYREHGEQRRAGGAANVALNLAQIGIGVEFVGAVGADPEGREVLEQLNAQGVGTSHCLVLGEYQTPLKTRVLANAPNRQPLQVLRMDRDPQTPLQSKSRARLARRIERIAGAKQVCLTIVSDYGYGHVGAELEGPIDGLIRQGTACVLDPRDGAFTARKLTALTPNLDDLARQAGVEPAALWDPGRLEQAALDWLTRANADLLLATLGRAGMALFGHSGELARVPSSGGDQVVDVSGAGDTAVAWFALCLGRGLEPVRAMEIANAAAGCSVLELGTATPDPARVQALCGVTADSNASVGEAPRGVSAAAGHPTGTDVSKPR